MACWLEIPPHALPPVALACLLQHTSITTAPHLFIILALSYAIQVLDLSSSDEDEDLPLSSRQPLAPRSAPGAAAVRPPLAFRRCEGPIEIDLAAEEDVCCLVRNFWGWMPLAGR